MKKYITVYLLLISVIHGKAQIAIIPRPQELIQKEGSFRLNPSTIISFKNPEDEAQLKNKLGDFVYQEVSKYSTSQKKKNEILFSRIDEPSLHEEGYYIEVSNKNIQIKARTSQGMWNAAQTLKQLIYLAQVGGYTKDILIPSCRIYDYPMFKWRGLMLDVSRHFFNKEEVKKYLDVMALYKFNRFHWHLSDDNGWRIEIKAFPRLTEVGAWRVERHGFFGERDAPTEDESTTYGGFYTQADIKEVVQYAQERNITIIPELDMPGHSTAAIAAYPQLSVTQTPLPVSPGHKFSNWFADGTFEMTVDNTLDPTSEYVYDFIEKVFKEVAALFPGEYIHIGGDECYHGFWKNSQKCQAFMQEKGIQNVEGLQSYFVNRVNKIIMKHGKKMIGWDEILEGGDLDKTSAVMNWRATGVNRAAADIGAKASQDGYYVVLCPTSHAYLDYTQGDVSFETKIYSALSLKKSYSFNPIPEGANKNFILGGQANLWTEQVPTLQHAFYMTYPRALSIVESLWTSNEKKNWSDFVKRIEMHFKLFDMQGNSVSKAIYDPILKPYKEADKLYVQVEHDLPDSVQIHYTIDNTFPTQHSPIYKSPILIPEGKKLYIRFQTYRNGEKIGRMLNISREGLLERIK